MAVYLKPLSTEHLEFVRCLRNHYREWFFDKRRIGPWDQQEWYFKYLKSNCLFWVIYYEDRPVGTISRSKCTDFLNVFELGNLMLLPPYQGRGIMQEALRQVTAMNTKAFYVAYVKSDNSASLRLFKQADFWRVPKKRRKKRA